MLMCACAAAAVIVFATTEQTNDVLRESLTSSSTDTLDGAIYKMDLINESLAFTIENIQVQRLACTSSALMCPSLLRRSELKTHTLTRSLSIAHRHAWHYRNART